MTFSTGAAIPVLDPAVTHLDVNAATTTALVNGAVDAETKISIPKGVIADLSFRGQLSGTGDVGATISVYRRDLAADGTNDADIPTVANRNVYVYHFKLPDSLPASTLTTCKLSGVPLNMSGECTFYIKNETGQTINAGWVVTATSVSLNAVS